MSIITRKSGLHRAAETPAAPAAANDSWTKAVSADWATAADGTTGTVAGSSNAATIGAVRNDIITIGTKDPASHPLGVTNASWTNAAGGDWGTAGNWSNDAVPGTSTAATVAAAGTYTVNIDTADVAASLTLSLASATVADTSSLSLTGALSVKAGVFELESGGSVVGGTLSSSGSGAYDFTGGTLSGVTWLNTLSIGASQSVNVVGGLEFGGNDQVRLGDSASLNVRDSETLNNATLTFAGSGTTFGETYSFPYSGPYNQFNATLTLGGGFTLDQTNGQNFLTVKNFQTQYFATVYDTLVNSGTISVTGGTLTLDGGGYFDNTGVINVNNGELQISGVNFANIGSISVSGTGTIDVLNASLTVGTGLSVGGSSVIIDDQGGSLSGTIDAATTDIQFAGGVLDAVTWQGIFSVSASQTLTAVNGLTVTGASPTLSIGTAGVFNLSGGLAGITSITAGTSSTFNVSGGLAGVSTITLDAGAAMSLAGGLSGTGAISLGNSALLGVTDSETLNNVTLTFAGSGATFGETYNSPFSGGSNELNATLTLGNAFILDQTSGQNFLTVHSTYTQYFAMVYDTLVSDGTISVTGGTLTTEGGGYFDNAGTINVANGDLQLSDVNFTNTGSISLSGTGTIDVLNASLAVGTGLSVSSGSVIIDDQGGSLSGTIDSATTHIQFAGGVLNAVTWEGSFSVAASQTVTAVNGLTVTGGSPTLAIGTDGVFNLSGGLAGITSITAGTSSTFNVSGGLASVSMITLDAGAAMSLAGGLSGTGAISLGNSALLGVTDSETLNNATLTFAGSGATFGETYNAPNSGSNELNATLTLGSAFILDQMSGQNFLTVHSSQTQYSGYVSDLLVNNGTISVTGGTLTTGNFGLFTSGGAISVSGGATLDLSGVTFTNAQTGTLGAGTYSVGAGSLLQLSNNESITTLATTLTLTGAGSTIEALNTSTNKQTTIDQSLATVAAGGVLTLLGGRGLAGASALSDSGLVTLAGGTVAETSVTIAKGGKLSGFGTIASNVTNSGSLVASGGHLTMTGALAGNGGVLISAGAALEIGGIAYSSEKITFGGALATLETRCAKQVRRHARRFQRRRYAGFCQDHSHQRVQQRHQASCGIGERGRRR